MPTMYGERILLRDYRQDDFQGIRAWVNDRETIRYLSSRFWMPQSETDTRDFLNHAMNAGPNGAFFIIADKKSGDYIGQIDLFSINWRLRSAEMGIVIACQKDRSHGVGAEAIGLLLEYAFTVLGLERVELEAAADNARANRCYQKAGFKPEGVKRHAFMVDGRFADLNLYGFLAEDWRESHGGD